ncbi:MAG: agmatine deiminase family protein [Ignavibacteriaceae bacterium]|nr:agmatine deiminase family protein [Ignavibacteriaceae bacterium]
MKKLLFFLLPLFFAAKGISQELPHYLTEHEKSILQTYKPPTFEKGFIIPPNKPVRTMAEWEQFEGIMITWTSYTSILRQIVDYAQDEGLVYIVCSDSNTVKNYLTSGNVPLYNLRFIIAQFNSIWIRDYGPWCVYSNNADSMYIIDWTYNRPRPLDDLIPGVFANRQNIPLYQMTTAPYNFVATGGNFMTDGNGTGFSSKLIINENPGKTEADIDTMMRRFMGINRYIKMNTLPYDGIHHIDMHMKLLDEETLLVGQYPAGMADGPQIEANLAYVLSNFTTCYGRPYKVVRIPMPPDAQGYYPNNGGDYRTYTNSLIVNKTVIVPTYELKYDTTALRIYRDAMPGYRVVGINSNQIIPALGTIHCITKEIGVSDPVFISHRKILSTANFTNGYEVKAYLKTSTGINSASVFWSTDTTQGFNSLLMNQFAADSFSASIPNQPLNTKIFYYISASSNSGRTVNKPLPSPAGAYQFTVDTQVPVELISFNAVSEKNNVILNWETATETNNYGFEIERKFDDFTTVGFVAGNGTSTEKKKYSFTDKNIPEGKYTYRIKQIDFNGKFAYSNSIEITVDNPAQFTLEQNYPNPFNPSTIIRYTVPSNQSSIINHNSSIINPEPSLVSLNVYDVLGNEVATLVNKQQTPGTYQVEFSAANAARNLSSGIYFYKISVGGFTAVKKMQFLK